MFKYIIYYACDCLYALGGTYGLWISIPHGNQIAERIGILDGRRSEIIGIEAGDTVLTSNDKK